MMGVAIACGRVACIASACVWLIVTGCDCRIALDRVFWNERMAVERIVSLDVANIFADNYTCGKMLIAQC